MDSVQLDAMRIALDPTSQIVLAFGLFTIMFSVALGLKVDDFTAITKKPLAYIVGALGQIFGLPLITLCLVFLLSPSASIALGMIVVASCPGGNVSNMMTYFGRGDVALSVALTATSSLIAAFLTPTFILLWASLYPPTSTLLDTIDFDPLSFILQTTALLAIPLLSGMALAHWAPQISERLRKPGALIGAGLIIVVVIVGTIDMVPRLFAATSLIIPPVLIHSGSAFTLGALIGLLIKASKPVRRTLTFEIGLQNTGLALVILLGQLEGLGGAAAVAAVWGVWHLIAGMFMVWFFRRNA